jgi:hypothetical protein
MLLRSKTYGQKALVMLYLAARYYAAFTLLLYGFAKTMGAQFTILDSQLARPLSDISGFWLTWYYFGYSVVYSSIVAWTQIIGSLMLCFRRTALIGALFLLPVMVNVVSIDIWVVRFPFASGALQNAICVLLALLVIVTFHAPDLYRIVSKRRDDLLLFAKNPRWGVAFATAIALGMFAYTAHEAYWIANVNNRAPTPIDGAWHVTSVKPANILLPEWMYFEYNRAYMVVFRSSNGKTETHDFRVDSKSRTLHISNKWLNPGSEIFDGTWDRRGDLMKVSGNWNKTTPLQMTLERRQMHVKDHQ